MSQLVNLNRHHKFLILTLNRPEKRNALNPQLIDELQGNLAKISKDDDIKALILTGSGSAFSAGADLTYLQEISKYNFEQNLADSQKLANLFKTLLQFPKITIALINGPALAGGFGLALCCDFLIADIDEATFGFTETRIGFIPAIVMNILIRKLSLDVARYLVMTAEIIPAKEAINKGIVDLGYAKKELEQKTIAFTKSLLAQNSFSAMIQTKLLFQKLVDTSLDQGLDLSIQENVKSRKTIDCKKGLEAFLNKDKINWYNQ